MSNQEQSFRSAFIQEQQNRTDYVLEEAQRLVNLYRHADSFGEAFMPELDKMLLAMSPEVQTALSDILGGQIVRQYYDYLKEKGKPAPEQDEQPETVENKPVSVGYLPQPDSETNPVPGGTADTEKLLKTLLEAHDSELKELLKEQTNTLSALLQRLNQKSPDSSYVVRDYQPNYRRQANHKKYSDVIEAGGQAPVLVPDETEGF